MILLKYALYNNSKHSRKYNNIPKKLLSLRQPVQGRKLSIYLVVFKYFIIYFFKDTNGQIDCYECTVHPPESYMNRTTRLCSKFDGSDHYKVHCPNSTYCMKKSFQLELQAGSTYNILNI